MILAPKQIIGIIHPDDAHIIMVDYVLYYVKKQHLTVKESSGGKLGLDNDCYVYFFSQSGQIVYSRMLLLNTIYVMPPAKIAGPVRRAHYGDIITI